MSVLELDRDPFVPRPEWLPEREVRMQGRAVETLNDTPTVAGIDISKLKLDVAFGPDHEMGVFANDVAGCKALCKALAARKITRVGVEASGGYERWIVTAARAVGIEVIVFQPNQVKAYAVFLGQRAKTDPIDARLIAACTAHAIVRGKAPIDPHYAVLAEYLTLIEQIEEDLTRAKTRREAFHQPALRRKAEAEVKRLTLLRAREIAALHKAVQLSPALAHRLALIESIDGIGLRTALALLIRMPELGLLSREQAAALAGLAPFDKQSGPKDGQRHIQGGRARLRRSLYAATFAAALKWNKQLVALYQRLTNKGAHHKKAIVACARKLVIFANAVVQRDRPWETENPIKT
jgi:transposase